MLRLDFHRALAPSIPVLSDVGTAKTVPSRIDDIAERQFLQDRIRQLK
jgi:hypothetical protein